MKQDVNIQFAIKNLKMKRKRQNKNLTSSGEDLNPGFLSILKTVEDVMTTCVFMHSKPIKHVQSNLDMLEGEKISEDIFNFNKNALIYIPSTFLWEK